MTPAWDLFFGLWKIGKTIAGFYDKIGITPNTVPHDENFDQGSTSGIMSGVLGAIQVVLEFLQTKVEQKPTK